MSVHLDTLQRGASVRVTIVPVAGGDNGGDAAASPSTAEGNVFLVDTQTQTLVLGASHFAACARFQLRSHGTLLCDCFTRAYSSHQRHSPIRAASTATT